MGQARQCISYTECVTPIFASPEGTARFAARFPALGAVSFYRSAQGCTVSSIGLGTYLGDADAATDRAYESAVDAALRSGINVVDTAVNYRHQRSEQSIGRAVDSLFQAGVLRRDEIVVSTKAGFLTPGAIPDNLQETAGNLHSMHPDFLEDQIARSRLNLRLDPDVFYLHNPETQLGFVAPGEFEERVRRAFARLEKLVSQGLIRDYGMATWNGFRLKPGQPERLDLKRILTLAQQAAGEEHHFRYIQMPINLAMPEAFTFPHADERGQPQSVLEVAVRGGLTVVASASLLQARLARHLPGELAAKFPGSTSDSGRALQFTRSTPGVTTALIGMSQAKHVEENLAAASLPPLTPEQYLQVFSRSG